MQVDFDKLTLDTESDVEQKVLMSLLTHELYLGF
jgi:hypothetical protein